MKIDGIIEDLGYHILNSKDENFLSDIMYAASLSDDELENKFYFYLSSFMEFFVVCICNPYFALNEYYRLIFQRLMILLILRFKRGLV